MDQFRQAKCTQCAASFKVPATFTASKAKCPKCKGVVEVGEVQGAAPKPEAPRAEAPAAKPVPAAVPPPRPAAPKPAAAAQPAPQKPAAAAKPAPAPVRPAAASAAPKATPPSVRSAAESAASKVKSGAAAKPSARKGKDGEGEHHEGKRHHHAPKKKSLAPAMIGILGMLACGGAAWWYFGVKLPAETQAKEQAEQTRTAERLAALAEQAAKDKAEMEAANAGHVADLAAADAAKGGDAPVRDAEASSPDKPVSSEPSQPKAGASSNIVDDIDLTALPELPKQSSCSDEQWDSLQSDARTMIDPSAGARGNRAAKRLEEAGRIAIPALLNQFRTINPATEDGFRAGDLIQKTLERICKGRNFGWQYSTELKDVVYNKKAIKNWFKIWETIGEDEQQWLGFTKQLGTPTDGGGAPAGGGDKPKSGLDDF